MKSAAPITFRHQSKWLAMGMIPLLLAGLVCTVFGIVIASGEFLDAKTGAGVAMVVLGFSTSLLSACVMSMRWELVIDRSQGRISRVRGTLGLYVTRTYSLKSFHSVAAQYRNVMTGTQFYDRYYVIMLANQDSLYLTEYGEPKGAIEKANEIGSYLSMPVEIDERTMKDLG